MFIVLAADADARRRHDDAGLARGGPEGSRARAAASSTSRRCCRWWSALLFLAVGDGAAPAYARALSADAPTAALAADYLLWFIPAMALQFGLVAMGAALRGTGNFKPGMVVQTATVIINIVLAPLLIFGWGTGAPLGVAGAAIATLIADRHRHRLDGVVLPAGATRICSSSARTGRRSCRSGGRC